jgi:hypothetical protein
MGKQLRFFQQILIIPVLPDEAVLAEYSKALLILNFDKE